MPNRTIPPPISDPQPGDRVCGFKPSGRAIERIVIARHNRTVRFSCNGKLPTATTLHRWLDWCRRKHALIAMRGPARYANPFRPT